MYFETAHESSLSLTRACLIYTNKSDVVVTDHGVANGQILPGRVIDHAAAAAIFAKRSSTAKDPGSDNLLTWRFPRMYADHPSWNIWWSAPGIHSVFAAKKAIEAWIPGMIWCGHRSKALLYLFAFAGTDAPKPTDLAYQPRFGPEEMNHIHGDSSLCIGTAQTTDKSPTGWENAFFDSAFKTNGNLSPKPFDVTKRFKKIGTITQCLERSIRRAQ